MPESLSVYSLSMLGAVPGLRSAASIFTQQATTNPAAQTSSPAAEMQPTVAHLKRRLVLHSPELSGTRLIVQCK